MMKPPITHQLHHHYAHQPPKRRAAECFTGESLIRERGVFATVHLSCAFAVASSNRLTALTTRH